MATESTMAKIGGALGFMPASRRSAAATTEESRGGKEGEGTAVKVVVRCRPMVRMGPSISIGTESVGPEKVSVKLEVPTESNSSPSSVASSRRLQSRSFRCNKYLGPETSQADVFDQASSIVEWAMAGYNGTIFCYGITGSGKTYTMTGPPEHVGRNRQPEAMGVVQRVSRRVFEYIRDRSSRGEVFVVEASFLEIYSEDGVKEQLLDLLDDKNTEKKLEVKQDPLSSNSYKCEGLSRVPIRSPDEMVDVLNSGQKKAHFMETSQNCHSSRSHCVFMLDVESLADGDGEPVVKRGKLMLVDLAGSESLKAVRAMDDANELLRQRQAMNINRTLTALGAIVNNIGTKGGELSAAPKQESALITMLRDCLGGSARGLVIANISPELEHFEESTKTLTFAQQMLAVRQYAKENRIKHEESSLMQMKSRHAACIRMLQDKAVDSTERETEERKKLQSEMEELNQRLLTQETAEKSLEQMRAEQMKKMNEIKDEMSKTMSLQLEQMRERHFQDLQSIRESVDHHFTKMDDSNHQRQVEEHEQKVRKLQDELQGATQTQREAEEEVAELRVRLAKAEERSKMLQNRQEELKKERSDFEQERKALRQQNDEHWQKLVSVEGEVQKFKTEAEVQQGELSRLHAAQAADAEKMRKEKDAWMEKESGLQRDITGLQKELEETKHEVEVQAIRSQAEQKEAVGQLKLQIEKLEGDAATRGKQLEKLRKSVAQIDKEKEAAKLREEELRNHGELELNNYRIELDDAKTREMELMDMLKEVQESIMQATQQEAR